MAGWLILGVGEGGGSCHIPLWRQTWERRRVSTQKQQQLPSFLIGGSERRQQDALCSRQMQCSTQSLFSWFMMAAKQETLWIWWQPHDTKRCVRQRQWKRQPVPWLHLTSMVGGQYNQIGAQPVTSVTGRQVILEHVLILAGLEGKAGGLFPPPSNRWVRLWSF